MRPCNVANVIKVEAQNRSKPCKTDGVLRSLQTCLEQPVIIDAAFPVLGLSSPRCACMRLIILHSLFSRQFAEHGRPACRLRSEEHTSELQSLMSISYAVFCLKKKICSHHQH